MRWRHIVISPNRRSVQERGAPVSCQILASNDAGVSFIVYNYAKNALNVQVVRRKETKFGLDCIFLTLCAGKSAFSPVSPVTMRLSSPRGDQGKGIFVVWRIFWIWIGAEFGRGDIAWALLRTLLFRDFIWLPLRKDQNQNPDLHQTFQNDFDVNLIMNTRLGYMNTGTGGCGGKKPASLKMKLPPSLTCIILSDVKYYVLRCILRDIFA